MRDHELRSYIQARYDDIVVRFRAELAKHRHVAGTLSRSQLVDHLPQFFEQLTYELAAQGRASLAEMALPAAGVHGRSRWKQGFDLREVVREYGILQHVILKDLAEHGFEPGQRELLALHSAINSGIAEAVAGFSAQKDALQDELAATDRELRTRQQRLDMVTDNVPDILWTAAPSGCIDWYNKRFFDYTGLVQIDTGWEWLAVAHPDDVHPVETAWRAAALAAKSFEVEYRLRHRSGSYRWHLVRASPVRDGHGQPSRWFATCTDVDEHRRYEQKLAEASAEAERLMALKDEFLATVSHELRTPLQAILGWSGLLCTGKLDQEGIVRAARAVERNAKAQANLISEILDLSNIMSGKGQLDMRPVELAPLLQEALDAIEPAARAKGLTIGKQIEKDVGVLLADAASLRRILWNLLSNATKFTSSGQRIQLTAKVVEQNVVIVVEDTGKGIDEAFLPFVFEPFRQSEVGPTRNHEGLGLGLTTVRQLVQQHGGTVSAESPGKDRGARFKLTFPRYVGSSAAPQEPASTRASAPATPGADALLGIRALLVEDEADARELISTILSEYGAWVRDASDACEAIRLLDSETFDVVVSDIAMPKEDGYSLIQKVRTRSLAANSSEIPAIALTARTRRSDKERALQAGFDRHLAKPVQPARLVTEVFGLTRRCGLRESLGSANGR